MPQASSYPTDTLDGTDKVLGTTAGGLVKNFPGTEFAKLNIENQTVAGGAGVTVKSIAFPVSPDVPITIDPSARPLQSLVNMGNVTINAPTVDGSCVLLIQNSVSPANAGTVTFSGFNVGTSTGDTITTTPAANFSVFIWRINGISGYNVVAHQ